MLDKEEEEQGTRSDLQARIIDLIGLTFEQFTRSVLLAQNDFSTFLKAEQGEKASLLEKLTGTELYSAISRQIFERNARAKEAFDLIQTRIQGIELLTDEEENDLRIRLAGTEKELQRVEKAKADGQSPPSPAFAGRWQPDISFRPLPYEALHSLTVAPSVTDRGWPHPTGCPVYAPARSPVEGI